MITEKRRAQWAANHLKRMSNPEYKAKKYARDRQRRSTPEFKEKQKAYDRSRRNSRKSGELKRKYGLTVDIFSTMLASQSNRCLNTGCSQPLEMRAGGYAVDHDHITGSVRGILCAKCNLALGCVDDSVEVLQGLIEYLGREKKD